MDIAMDIDIVLEVTPQPAGPELPEPSPPSEPGPAQPDVPSPDPRGPETPGEPIEPDPPLPTQPAEYACSAPQAWKHRQRALCAPQPAPR